MFAALGNDLIMLLSVIPNCFPRKALRDNKQFPNSPASGDACACHNIVLTFKIFCWGLFAFLYLFLDKASKASRNNELPKADSLK